MDPLRRIQDIAPTKKAFSLATEFKNFAFKGNVIDLAVGVIIGATFGKIVSSLVEHIMMPLIALIVGTPGDDFRQLEWRGIKYGEFIAAIINFLLVAVVLFFIIVKFLGWLMRNRNEEAAVPAPPTKDQELLTEIRDLLKKESTSSGKATT